MEKKGRIFTIPSRVNGGDYTEKSVDFWAIFLIHSFLITFLGVIQSAQKLDCQRFQKYSFDTVLSKTCGLFSIGQSNNTPILSFEILETVYFCLGKG